MDKENFVSIDWVLKKLGFDDMPKKLALESVANLVSSKEIDLYFDKSTQGTDKSVDLEMQYEASGVFLGALIGNGYSYQHDGAKLATALCVCSLSDTPKFAIQEYSINDVSFYATDVEGIWNCEMHLDANDAFFDRKQIESLSKSRAKNIDGKTKALALLAREAADKSSKFRHGNKVNAKAFKDHVVELAKEYLDPKVKVPDGNIRKLDDSINKALIELDLKDIT